MFQFSIFWILFVTAFGSLSSAVEFKVRPTPLGAGVLNQDFAVTMKLTHVHNEFLFNGLHMVPDEVKPEYKFHASIERNGGPLCSGAVLYSLSHVITAASCDVKVTDDVFIDRPRISKRKGERLGISYVKNHPDFRFNETVHKFDFDIAIIRLNKKITSNIFGLYLNNPSSGKTEGKVTFYTNMAKGLVKQTLVVIDSVPIISSPKCIGEYGFNLTNNMLCAGSYSSQSFCSEDRGSPLFDGNILIGIKSWGERCSRVLLPSVYTNVYPVRRWIYDTVNEANW